MTQRTVTRIVLLAMVIGMVVTLIFMATGHAESYAVTPEIAIEKGTKIIDTLKVGYQSFEAQVGDEARLVTMLSVLDTYMRDNRDAPVNDIDDDLAVFAIDCKEYLDSLEEKGVTPTAIDRRIEFFYKAAVDYRNRKVSPVNTIYVGTDTKKEIEESKNKDFDVVYDTDNNVLHLFRNGSTEEVTLNDIFYKIQDNGMTLLYRESPDVWILKTTISVEPGMRLVIKNPKPTTYLWLKLANCGSSPSRIIVYGELVMDAVRVSSWDPVADTFMMDPTSPRGEIKFIGGSGIVQHCRIEHIGYASASRQTHGITTIDCTDVKIYDNTIVGGFQGINIQHSSGVIVRGNVIDEPFDTGILLENGSVNCDLLSNIVNASGRHGIMVFDRCHDCDVSLNTLSNNVGHGIKVFKWCHDLGIDQNIAKDNMRNAIAVFACENLTISDNLVTNGSGIFVSHKSDGVTIIENRLVNTTTAIALIGTSDEPQKFIEAIDVSYNEFEIYSEYNIVESMYGDVTHCLVKNNDIRVCSREGIKLFHAHHNDVDHNTIVGSEKYGILLIGSWYNRFVENDVGSAGKAKYGAISNSYENHMVKHGVEYTLTDRGCVVSDVDANGDGCVNANELGLLVSYIIESIMSWFI